jgi:tRNA dimethylallyltransferase
MAQLDTTPILIAGATASGKSALALALAKKLNGVIINADSMQVYNVLRVLTARPDADEEGQAPHRLYGHIAPGAPYSVGIWQKQALAEIAAAQNNQQVPILVGGTGLYFASLTEGLSDIPDIPEDIRAGWRARLAAEGAASLYDDLTGRDPELAARLQPADGQRIVRALEVEQATGTPLSVWQKIKPTPPLDGARKILLMPDRDWLYARCNARFEAMMNATAIAEVEKLWAYNLPPDTPAMKALGVSEILSMLTGEIDRPAAIEAAQQATRRYAKRQMTWFRHRMGDWQAFTEKDYEKESKEIFSFIT